MLPVLERWVTFVTRHAWLVLVTLAILTLCLGFIAYDRFRMNSDLGQLIRQDASWRVDYDRYLAEFPQLVNTLVLVIASDSGAQADAAAQSLTEALAQRPQFSQVFAPANEPFLRDHGLYYLEAEALDDLVDRLAQAQPMLAAVSADPSLRAVLDTLAKAVVDQSGANTERIMQLLAESATDVLEGDDPTIQWRDEFAGVQTTQYRLVIAKGALNFGDALPNTELVREARDAIAGSNLPGGVSVQLTGEVALAHEEIDAALNGVKIAGWVSVVFLLGILILGVRSGKIIVGIFLMLFVGVIWTSGYAMLAVGEYNTLSVVFLVMFFGLGVDFAVHFSLRYQEVVNTGINSRGAETERAMQITTHSVGGAIGVCTLTTAIGFLGFWPTDYKGLADLGVISAGGMFVAAFLTFTLLPAWYSVVGGIRPHVTDLPSSDLVVALLVKQRRVVLSGLAALTIVCGWFAVQTHFDYSVLALRDNNSESMQALRTLQRENLATDYSLSVLSKSPNVPAGLAQLPEVESVVTASGLIPARQDETALVLDDAQQVLWSLMQPEPAAATPSQLDLQKSAQALLDVLPANTQSPAAAALRSRLVELLNAPAQLLKLWQPAVVEPLVAELAWIRRALSARPFEFDALPTALQRNFLSPSGTYIALVNPTQDLSDVEHLSQFIQGVHRLAPTATGRPVVEWGVGTIVLNSFYTALAIALVGILAVLFVTFRNFTDSLLILVPLALAVLVTLAIGVWADKPLNMASILVVPLIFGLGVDNGIHVVDRFRGAGDVYHLMHSSTPRAVLISTLTTIGTFAALMLSAHQGTASIGFLLTCAVSLVLLFTVFLLPVLLSVLDSDA